MTTQIVPSSFKITKLPLINYFLFIKRIHKLKGFVIIFIRTPNVTKLQQNADRPPVTGSSTDVLCGVSSTATVVGQAITAMFIVIHRKLPHRRYRSRNSSDAETYNRRRHSAATIVFTWIVTVGCRCFFFKRRCWLLVLLNDIVGCDLSYFSFVSKV